MEFEFDPGKSKANRDKHGIDFVEAQELWDVWAAQKPLTYIGEDRFLRIGMFGKKLWVAVFTLRNERVRLISVRRARQNEVREYEQAAKSGSGRFGPQS